MSTERTDYGDEELRSGHMRYYRVQFDVVISAPNFLKEEAGAEDIADVVAQHMRDHMPWANTVEISTPVEVLPPKPEWEWPMPSHPSEWLPTLHTPRNST